MDGYKFHLHYHHCQERKAQTLQYQSHSAGFCGVTDTKCVAFVQLKCTTPWPLHSTLTVGKRPQFSCTDPETNLIRFTQTKTYLEKQHFHVKGKTEFRNHRLQLMWSMPPPVLWLPVLIHSKWTVHEQHEFVLWVYTQIYMQRCVCLRFYFGQILLCCWRTAALSAEAPESGAAQ